ncbi:MAG: histidine phosphatase family protein [Chitinophagaceae bacterium]
MKTAILVRHAKSSWDSGVPSDFDRPLNDRGKHDAPMMAKRLADKKLKIDAIISSPAKRAKKTAEEFAEVLGVKEKNFILVDELYHAGVTAFDEAIATADNSFDSLAIFSHNPGITEYVNTLTDEVTSNMPTCGIFAVRADVKSWKQFNESKKEFLFFDYPKRE